MSFQMQESNRVGQSAYWMYFGINMVLGVALLFGGIAAIITGNIGIGTMCLLAILPMGIYFRVIMMRRCRDIGWPTFLPWLPMGFAMLCGAIIGAQIGAHSVPSAPLLVLPSIVNLLDFAMIIVIGCMPGQSRQIDYVDDPDYFAKAIRAHAFDGQPAAVARAAGPRRPDPAPAPAPAPATQRPVPGFGRKIV